MVISRVGFRIDRDLHVKDHANDTIYAITNSNLQPAYVFDVGKYSYPLDKINDEGKIKIMRCSGYAKS